MAGMPPNPIPAIPALFLERMRRLLGDEYAAFASVLEEEPVGGLRVNTLKLTAEEFARLSPFPLGDRVEWCDPAFILPTSDLSFGSHPYHLAGLYYLQDASAMAPAELLMGAPFPLRPEAFRENMRILDLAAAPGGKTTGLAALMQGHGLLVANEIKDKRVGHLAVNVERWGAGNVVITNETPERLADHFGASFDRVLVDAPCSGEGMFRKDMEARRDWSPEMVAGCAIRQRNILRVAAKLVRPGGYLLYSTCTFAPEEDEGVINGLIHAPVGRTSTQFEVVKLAQMPGFMPGRPEWLESNEEQITDECLRGAVRLFPHRVTGEGHFICLLKKSESPDEETPNTQPPKSRGKRTGTGERRQANWKPDRLTNPSTAQEGLWQEFAGEELMADLPADRLRVRAERLYFIPGELPDFGSLRVLHPGVWLGTFKKERFEPAHPLALFLRRGQARNVLDLRADSREMGAYLRGESIPSQGPPGWTLVTAEGWPLGWGKRVQGLLKNHYPRGWQMHS